MNYGNKTIFYCLYDRKDLDDKYFINGLSKMLINGIDRYFNLTLYYYFIILNKFNKDMFHILLNIDNKINENNYKEIITQYKNKLKVKVENYDYYSPNRYDGHNNVIPDMIVCHISFDYGKIIKNFKGGVYSYQEHLVKPDKSIYNLILKKYNLKKEETIFFDDKLQNVKAAEDVGIKAILFKSIDDIKNNI